MANNYSTLAALFADIAGKIRSKTGGTASIVADNFPAEIEKIVTLASGTSDATAAAGEILTGKTAYAKGSKVTGSMANNGAVSQAINAGGSYTIPAGYHNGSGKVTGNSLASQTSATAAAADILSGKTAWVNGSKLTGTAKKGVSGTFSYPENTRTQTITIPELIGCNKFVLYATYMSSAGSSSYLYARTVIFDSASDHCVFCPYQRSEYSSRSYSGSETVTEYVTFDSVTGTITLTYSKLYFYNSEFIFFGV